ncbi:MAG: hypothetical protein ACI90V_013150 [Bacillariaceae sp.]|jgi:hypothetical protein
MTPKSCPVNGTVTGKLLKATRKTYLKNLPKTKTRRKIEIKQNRSVPFILPINCTIHTRNVDR